MKLEYTYQIAKVDKDARCMEIVYSSDGKKTMRVGTRLPYEGETIEDIVKSYAPISYWKEQELNVITPIEGITGNVSIDQTKPNLVKEIPSQTAFYPNYEADKQAIKDFFFSKGIIGEPSYITTMYNITAKEIVANLFGCGYNLAKVKDQKITEWYESDVLVGNTLFAFVSKDLNNGKVIDKYTFDQRGLVKTTPNSSEDPVVTRFGNYESIPPMIKKSLENFEHRNYITGWSLKSSGLVVEVTYPKVP